MRLELSSSRIGFVLVSIFSSVVFFLLSSSPVQSQDEVTEEAGADPDEAAAGVETEDPSGGESDDASAGEEETSSGDADGPGEDGEPAGYVGQFLRPIETRVWLERILR